VTRRASDSSAVKESKGDKGSDSEGFSFGGLLKAVKSVRQKMVRSFAAF